MAMILDDAEVTLSKFEEDMLRYRGKGAKKSGLRSAEDHLRLDGDLMAEITFLEYGLMDREE